MVSFRVEARAASTAAPPMAAASVVSLNLIEAPDLRSGGDDYLAPAAAAAAFFSFQRK